MFRCVVWMVPVLCLLAFASPRHAAAQVAPVSPWADSRPEDLSIQLATFGPGDEIYGYFGHNALIVEDRLRDTAHLYNFGAFDFSPDMLAEYVKGRLTFWVDDAPVVPTFAMYKELNRSIHLQELNLAPAQRMAMAQALATQALPENRDYLYDHYRDNCSTRLRDLIDTAIGGQFHRGLDRPARMDYRDHTRRYAEKDPILEFTLTFWMNGSMDVPIREWDEMFLPGELEAAVARAQYVDASGKTVPLVSAVATVFEARRVPVPEQASTRWPYALVMGCAAGGLLWLTARWLRCSGSRRARCLFGAEHVLIGLSLGAIATVSFLAWAFSGHDVLHRSANQMLANPLTLLLAPLGIGIALGSARAMAWARYCFYALAATSLALVVLELFSMVGQDTALTMALLVPLNIAGALAHRMAALDG